MSTLNAVKKIEKIFRLEKIAAAKVIKSGDNNFSSVEYFWPLFHRGLYSIYRAYSGSEFALKGY